MDEETINKLKEEFVGKTILSVIDLDATDELIKDTLKRITENTYSNIDSAHLVLFEDKKAIVFVDFDSDGYRSGDWNLILIRDLLDKGFTKGIKAINSRLINMEYFPEAPNDEEVFLLTTEEYVIKMGQSRSDSYYPRNFFDVQECKNFALGKMEKLK